MLSTSLPKSPNRSARNKYPSSEHVDLLLVEGNLQDVELIRRTLACDLLDCGAQGFIAGDRIEESASAQCIRSAVDRARSVRDLRLMTLAAQAIENARSIQRIRQGIKASEERLSQITHDLCAQLTAIKAGVRLLGMQADNLLEPDELALLADVSRNVTRLSDMVSELLSGDTVEQKN